MKKLIFFISLYLLFITSFAHTPIEWLPRSIYQILTDRFARTDGGSTPCSNISYYCGGTFKGIMNNLDYIQGMGFDAIWISPVVANTEGGYHGYWAKNIYEVNENFGTEEELIALVDECHKRDVWVMVDIVANHMAPLSTSSGVYDHFTPFNDPSHYHSQLDCGTVSKDDQTGMEICWLSELPDLNQNIPFVKDKLIEWIGELVAKYKFDGLRIDTVPYVSKEFWKEFSGAAGVYTVGEVFDGRLPYDAGYQGSIDAVLNYPLYFAMRDAFQKKQSMYNLEKYFRDDFPGWTDPTLLGNFVDNHDNARFLNGNNDIIAFKSALAFAMTSVGIPITYYGSEQAYSGGNDPENREPLWTTMNHGSDIYGFLAILNNFRKESKYFNSPQIQRYVDDHFYAFTRDDHLFAFTNTQENQQRIITYHDYPDGTLLCNLFFEEDCVTVENRQFPVYLNNGEVKILSPKRGQNVVSQPTEQGMTASMVNSMLSGVKPGEFFGNSEAQEGRLKAAGEFLEKKN